MKKLNIPVHPVMTNGDFFRSLSDEMLVEIIGYGVFCEKIPFSECKAGDMTCDECALEWLKEPAVGNVFRNR